MPINLEHDGVWSSGRHLEVLRRYLRSLDARGAAQWA